jgi:hypothetical protein
MTGTCETRDEAQLIASILAGETQLYHELIKSRALRPDAFSHLIRGAGHGLSTDRSPL